jgi:hypothetical protein
MAKLPNGTIQAEHWYKAVMRRPDTEPFDTVVGGDGPFDETSIRRDYNDVEILSIGAELKTREDWDAYAPNRRASAPNP